MDLSTRRAPLPRGRRLSLNVNISPDVHRELGKLCGGNRSAAIEELVRRHVERLRAERTPTPERTPVPDPVT
jgi:hypothetical protein